MAVGLPVCAPSLDGERVNSGGAGCTSTIPWRPNRRFIPTIPTNAVIGLSGYVTAEDGEILAFAFLYNGTDRFSARETIDLMGPTMAGFSRE